MRILGRRRGEKIFVKGKENSWKRLWRKMREEEEEEAKLFWRRTQQGV